MISFSSLSRYFASAFSFYVGGGIGEAALIGAAFGGGKALVTGEDPLKAALLGGVTGGAMSGITSALPVGELGSTAAGEATNQAISEGVAQTANMLPQQVAETGMFNASNMLTGAPIQAGAPTGISGLGGMQAIPSTASMPLNNMVSTPVTSGGLGGGAIPAEEIAKQAATPNAPFVDLKNMVNPEAGGMLDKGFDFAIANPYATAGGAGALYGVLSPPKIKEDDEDEEKSPLAGYDRNSFTPYDAPRPDPYPQAQYTDYFKYGKEGGVMHSYAQGGIADLAAEKEMSGRSHPQGLYNLSQYATPSQAPISGDVVGDAYGPAVNTYSGMAEGGVASFALGGSTGYTGMGGYQEANGGQSGMGKLFRVAFDKGVANQPTRLLDEYKVAPVTNPYKAKYKDRVTPREYTGPQGGIGPRYSLADSARLLNASAPTAMADGGIAGYNLGGYAAGGNPRLLKGPGDGMSDNIPATIGDRQPARLADGEFVVPADVVSHLGNGSTDAGAKHLYTMMDRVRKARTGNKKQGKQIKPTKFLPA